MTLVSSIVVLDDIGRSLREGFYMFWETLWPLVLGFGLSGIVQSFVSRQSMQRALGDHRAPAVVRAAGFGMVSSSCSYAASAMAKSMIAKGADFVASMVFMFASTNLVIELGIVLIVLMGWQFAASEFVGGVIMIVLLVLVGGLYLRGRTVIEAQARLSEADADADRGGHGGNGGGSEHDHGGGDQEGAVREERALGSRLREKGRWADAASYTMADLTMLRKELVIGYAVAGFLAALVPVHVWNVVFLHGHGVWTSLENVVVGPFIAVISFVCSVGNVPLAAALWSGGISFGGVVSFIFADLIALPLLLIYRRFYGTRLMLRMLAVFWLVMSLAGLATEAIFRAAGLVPTVRPTHVVTTGFSWNYTTYLNIVFLALFAFGYWAYRNRVRLGGGGGYALDPMCGMQVRKAEAPATATVEGQRYYFCSDHCAARFKASPPKAVAGAEPSPHH